MGLLTDFREVVKGLKHKKRGEATIQLCPKCQSPKIKLDTKDAYFGLYGITPRKYICPECGYRGPIVLEKTQEKEEEN